MIKLIRRAAPNWLTGKWKAWGLQYQNQVADPRRRNKLDWPMHKGVRVNQLLYPLLAFDTKDHCSFCDAYPMIARVPATIEHFYPKVRFPAKVLAWENLFICCGNCQQKGDEFNRYLLKPDAGSYSFHKYFLFNYSTGELEPQVGLTAWQNKRASETIRLYRLNDHGKPDDRLEVLERWLESAQTAVDQYCYRFMF